jgi:DNA-binding NarL/FixJ family response regulator
LASSVVVTPRILIAGRDEQLRLWLRHHLQTLWPEAEPPSLDLQQFAHHLDTITRRNYDALLLCASFGDAAGEHSDGSEWLRQLRREPLLPPLVVVAAQGNELEAVRAIRLGAAAYLPRDLLDARLLERTLRKVLHAGKRRARRTATAGRRHQDLPAAPQIPNYRLLRPLGRSVRASVWLARSGALQRTVALKISEPVAGEAADVQQFAREYAAIAALRDPAIVDIYDYGVHDGREFLAMEYFPCGDLKQRLLNPMTSSEAVAYARRIAAALGVVHARGIVHRDLKPPNVMLRPDGSVVLIDFGLAKRLDSDTHSTAIGVLRGSPYYMSPEQVQGRPLDARSDQYALGVVFYEMLTGCKPFTGLTAMDLMQQHVAGTRPALPAELAVFEPIVARLMARERDQRFADIGAALAELEDLPLPADPATAGAAAGAADAA